ncbi:MAG: acetyl-CoA carboxylase biotin carboxyl carrier protein [Fidelibacterota bacterium]
MRISKILELVKIVEDHDIGEIEVTSFGTKIKILKTGQSSAQSRDFSSVAPSISLPQSTTQETAPVVQKTEATNVEEIKSPMVGTFYRAPAPDADPFFKVGDQVTAGQTVCIIEAMKVMNEIESEVSGTIVKILVENGEPVEFDQPLFIVEK